MREFGMYKEFSEDPEKRRSGDRWREHSELYENDPAMEEAIRRLEAESGESGYGDLEEEKIYERNRIRRFGGSGMSEIGGEFGFSKVKGPEKSAAALRMDKIDQLKKERMSTRSKIRELEKIQADQDLDYARKVERFRADLYRDNPMWSLFKSNSKKAIDEIAMLKAYNMIDFEKELKELEKNIDGVKEVAEKVIKAGMVVIDKETNMEVTNKLAAELIAVKTKLVAEMKDREDLK